MVTAAPIAATKFVILNPTDGNVGDNITITVRAEDNSGNLDTSYQNDVTLVASLGIYKTYSFASGARAFVSEMGKVIADTIKQNTPEYTRITKGYEEATNFLKDLKQATGISNIEQKVNYDTALRKLTSAMRQNNELRLQYIKELQNQAGIDITGKIAGTAASSLIPKGLISKLGFEIGGLGIITRLLSPQTILYFLGASPRIVGEFVQTLGFSTNKTASFLKMLNEMKYLITPITIKKK